MKFYHREEEKVHLVHNQFQLHQHHNLLNQLCDTHIFITQFKVYPIDLSTKHIAQTLTSYQIIYHHTNRWAILALAEVQSF